MRIQRVPTRTPVNGSRFGRQTLGRICPALGGLFSKGFHEANRFLDLAGLQSCKDSLTSEGRSGREQDRKLCPGILNAKRTEHLLKTGDQPFSCELASGVKVVAGTRSDRQ